MREHLGSKARRRRIGSRLAAAVVATALVAALSWSPARAGEDSPPGGALFGPPHCVVAVSAETGFVSFAPPSAETANDVVSLVLRPVPDVAPGDLVRLERARGDGSIQPAVAVIETAARACSRFTAAQPG